MGLMARFEHHPRCWVPQNVLHTPPFLPAIDIALGPPIIFIIHLYLIRYPIVCILYKLILAIQTNDSPYLSI